MEATVDEVKRLEACVDNLIGILTLIIVFAGNEAHQTVTALLDALIDTLRLDFVYVKLKGPAGSMPIEMIRSTRSDNLAWQEVIVNEVLKASLECETQTRPLVVQKPTEEGEVSVAVFRLGMNEEMGVLAAGARRTDFPDANERLLLEAAASQATVGLQKARLLGEQRRHARERSLEAGHETRELNSFFTIFHDLHSITDRLGYFWWLNGAWEKMLGYSRSELLATPFMELIHREDVTATRAAYADLIAGRNITNFVNRCRYKDGTYRWFEWSAVLGNQMVYCSGRDITERKRAEADLREAFNEIKKLKDQLTRDNIALREEIDRTSMFEEIVGASPALKAVLARVAKVAPTDSTVLITGETGTGKELIARAIHKRSQRASRPFVSVSCAAIPSSLMASELFGHEKGAFTGAHQRRLGRFELAEGGTIFLDEIGELPSEIQIALLRVLQEQEFERVGGSQTIRTDVRVISATSRDLKAAIEAGIFRSDLFYRLNVFPIQVPQLRERKEDIPMLVAYFIDRYASRMGKKIQSTDKKTMDLFQSYPWPGNIRELQNVIERSVILCETETFLVDENWLVQESCSDAGRRPHTSSFSDRLFTHEKEIIEAALLESRGRVSGPMGAAARLGLPSSTLESKIRSLRISKRQFKPAD